MPTSIRDIRFCVLIVEGPVGAIERTSLFAVTCSIPITDPSVATSKVAYGYDKTTSRGLGNVKFVSPLIREWHQVGFMSGGEH